MNKAPRISGRTRNTYSWPRRELGMAGEAGRENFSGFAAKPLGKNRVRGKDRNTVAPPLSETHTARMIALEGLSNDGAGYADR